MSIDISVIVCSFNHAKWLERCIRSISNQENISDQNFEIIIIDDCSTDETPQVVNNLKSIANLKSLRNEKNLGLPKSINIAMHISKGRYLVRVDSDDYVQRNFLFMMKFFLDLNRQYQAVCVDYINVSENEEFLERKNAIKDEIACGIMFRREALFDLGLYNENFKMREGHELRKRFLEKFSMGHLELPLYKYRDHQNNRTKNIKDLEEYDKKL
jgi:glycosyltransferase involved in cell wall biosynthesis|tara:strand:+ start:4014 stop:4655 length:642 start_codon:yes stop_codon:yes gene_type:complete